MDIDAAWIDCVEEIKKKISKQQFTTWVTPLNYSYNNETQTVLLSAPNQFILQWVKDRFYDEIRNKFINLNKEIQVEFKSIKKTKAPLGQISSIQNGTKEIEGQAKTKPTGLNKSFNFGNFVTGKANQLATAAAKQIAENPGKSYNPLFIYGGVGLGKTHLIQAIGNELRQTHPDAKIKYLHAERYVSDVVKAYENKSFDSFKKQYHSLDLLLIDDIQFIGKKKSHARRILLCI